MEPSDVSTEEPLPAPTGSRAMAMFLGQPAAAGTVQGPAPAAEAQPRAASPAAQGHLQPPAPQIRQQQPPAAAAGQQPRDDKQEGMSKLDYETCVALQHILAKYKEADPFRQPVDVEALGIPDYLEIIKHPMDLKTVREKLKAGKYKSMQEWRDDVQLIWDNAIKYNGEGHVVSNQALKLQQAVERRFDAAVEAAKQVIAAEARGEPRPRKSHKPRTTELQALTGGAPAASSDSDSLDELAAAAAGGRRSPDVTRAMVKREHPGDAASRPPKRRATSGAAAAGPSAAAGDRNLGLDPETLVGMLNTPMARQLGAEEPDDLGFLAMWKRLMTRKQQLATDAETARAASQQLRSTVSQLQERLREEGMAKQAAVAVRAELEERLQDAERERDHWQTEFQNQKQIIESQRDLLEQQQQVLRKLAAQKQATMTSEAR